MKKMKLILLLFVAFTFILLVGCETTTNPGVNTQHPQTKIKLDTPANVKVVEYNGYVVAFFDGDKDAAEFSVTVYSDGKYETRVTADKSSVLSGVAVFGLKNGNYTIRVRAFVAKNSTLLDSDFTEDIPFVVTGSGVTPTGKYVVKFDSKGGSNVASQIVNEGDTVTKPVNPTKDSYEFVEWQLNGIKYNFTEAVTHEITLTAVWKEKINTDGGTPSNLTTYYKAAEGLTGNALKAKLHTIISTGVKNLTYADLKTLLPKTDADPKDSSKMLLLFSHEQVNAAWDGAATWNREHVWPQSKGWFSTSGAGADIHHIRPEDPTVNGKHGNLPYGEVTGGTALKYNNKIVAYIGSGKFEPLDEFKGDIARIIMYLLVRYSESDNYPITNVISSFNLMLEWHIADPVDEFEILRNERSYQYQKNRNPFIDYPEFADLIW